MKYLVIQKKDSKAVRVSKKRFNHKAKRKNKAYKNSDGYLNKIKKGKYYALGKKSIVFTEDIERFCNTNYNLTSRATRLVVKLNDDFTLFNNPAQVLLSLLNLLKHGKVLSQNPKVTYDGYVSFGAIYLIDNLCWEIGKKRKWVVDFHKFPPEQVSILSKLRSIVSSHVEDENEYMINERVLINRSEDPTSNQAYKVKAKDITDMVEKAIRESSSDSSYQLPLEIHHAIKSAIGEQFDNIHLHATETSYGTLCGFYNKITQEITILIYNFGKTIAETLSSPDTLPKEILNEILDILRNHSAKKILNFTSAGEFTLENAVTLLALQEGISSRIKYDITRGHGLIDFIENCFDLSEDTKVAIISGKTAIKIDKKYRISNKNIFGRDRRIIALNSDNDLYKKPDPNYIRNTGVNFNGVIIETTIPLKIN